MPEPSARHGIDLPLGSDNVTRLNYRTVLEQLDQAIALVEELPKNTIDDLGPAGSSPAADYPGGYSYFWVSQGGAVNTPWGDIVAGQVHTWKPAGAGATVIQIAVRLGTTSHRMFFRTAMSGDSTWGEWKEIAGSASPGCLAFRSTAQSIPNNTPTPVEFNAEAHDSDGFHDNATNPERITIPAGMGGRYHILCAVRFAHNATGRRAASLVKNGTDFIGSDNKTGAAGDSTGGLTCLISTYENLVAGDFLIAQATQVSGDGLDVSAGRSVTYFGVARLGDAT